jgi:F420-0:gamma-glutamyl ligase-like protein
MKVRRVHTKYWKPGTGYLDEIGNALKDIVEDRDIVAVSEKAVSVALGNIADERRVNPKFSARLLAKFWMRVVWGYILGYLCHLKISTVRRLRRYPLLEGARHKELVLERVGMLQALRFGSEGGIDASNIADSYVCLPLNNPVKKAKEIYEKILTETGKSVIVMIVDSDKTYSLRNLHLSPTKTSLPRIFCRGGFLLYLAGRVFKLKPRSTPKAVFPPDVMTVEEALHIAEVSHHVRGHGAGRTVWDMAERFNVGFTGVSWQMLLNLRHYPIVIVRRE